MDALPSSDVISELLTSGTALPQSMRNRELKLSAVRSLLLSTPKIDSII